jgi:response regulator NasT
MSRSLRIAVADDEQDMRDYFARILPRMGHEVVCVARNGRELIQNCFISRPDLLIVDIKMPEVDGLDAVAEICRVDPVPVIVVSAYYDAELVERAQQHSILAYLVKPIKQADLEPAIGIAMRRFAEFQALHQEASDLRQALEDRKTIERAKGRIMRIFGLEEQAAFRHLQKTAQRMHLKLADMARRVLAGEEASQLPHDSDGV